MAEQAEEITSFTKYEKARMIGSRALQLAMGAPFLVKLSEKDLEEVQFNPIKIAKIEFEKGVLPITVKRPLPGERKAKAEEDAKAKEQAPAKAE